MSVFAFFSRLALDFLAPKPRPELVLRSPLFPELDPNALEMSARPHVVFEDAVVAGTDDAAAWQIYADWLIEQGESWGEVIIAAHRGQPDRGRQRAAEVALLREARGTFTWRGGVLDLFDFQPQEEGDERMEVVLERVLKHPAGHFIRKLRLGLPPSDDAVWHMGELAQAIAKAGPLPLLTELDLSADAVHMNQISWRRVGDLRGIWKAAPHLKVLLLQGSSGADGGVPALLAPIEAPRLERFVFKSGGLDESVPLELGAARLPSLVHLELWFGRREYGCTASVASLAGILEGEGLPSLKTLALPNSPWNIELIEAVARSKLLPRLERVEFSMGVMGSESAAALRRNAQHFRHLERLGLDDNSFSEADQQSLRELLPNAHFGKQKHGDDPDDRYTTVGE